ncbi:MAG: zinc-ribbon domain containing protein [Verrucomicrobiales bacterium]
MDSLPPHMPSGEPPEGAVLAEADKLSHLNTYGDLPKYYTDYEFCCADCGSDEIWTAERQKWYYEVAKGHIWEIALRCRECRRKPKSSSGAGSGSNG